MRRSSAGRACPRRGRTRAISSAPRHRRRNGSSRRCAASATPTATGATEMAVSKVLMPKLSEAMETGKIIKWLKKEGDRIQAGDILAEVETDKADVEMEAFDAGVLRKILQPAGSTVPVGGLIGVIAEPDEDIAALTSGAGAPAAPAAAAATEMASRSAAVPPQPRREDPAARMPSPAAGPTAPPRLTTVPAAAPAPSVSAARPAAP